jgi:hypothetical protein
LGDTLSAAEEDGSEMPSVITALGPLILTGARRPEVMTAKSVYVDFE